MSLILLQVDLGKEVAKAMTNVNSEEFQQENIASFASKWYYLGDLYQNTFSSKWDPSFWSIFADPASGSSVDWFVGDLGVRFSFGFELRGDGFDPEKHQITPAGEETWAGHKVMFEKMIQLSTNNRNELWCWKWPRLVDLPANKGSLHLALLIQN